MTEIVAKHTSKSGMTFEVRDRGSDGTRAVMIVRNPDGTVKDRVRATTGARWEDDELASYYRTAVRLNP